MWDKMITGVLRRTPRRTHSAWASTSVILVDTSLASLIMDGELWDRSPADLRLYRQDVIDPEPEKNSLNLKRSIAAHSWAQSLRRSNDSSLRVDLRITPTVWQELANARQVSSTCILSPDITHWLYLIVMV